MTLESFTIITCRIGIVMLFYLRKILVWSLIIFGVIITEVTAADKMYIAIVDFEVTTDLEFDNPGKAIARMMINPLKETGQFRIFERVLLRKIIDEQILSESDYVDDKKRANKAGQIYGVQGIVSGSIVRWGDSITVVVQLLNTTSGEILKSTEIRTRDINLIPERLSELASILSGSTSNSSPTSSPNNFVDIKTDNKENSENYFKKYYVVIASTKESYTAIERAKKLRLDGLNAEVYYSSSKYYGVVIKFNEKETAYKQKYILYTAGIAPKDAYISNGSRFINKIFPISK